MTQRMLSARELQIAKLFAQGHKGSDIARLLGRSPKTVDSHKCRIKDKMEIYTGVQWMQYLRSFPLENADAAQNIT